MPDARWDGVPRLKGEMTRELAQGLREMANPLDLEREEFRRELAYIARSMGLVTVMRQAASKAILDNVHAMEAVWKEIRQLITTSTIRRDEVMKREEPKRLFPDGRVVGAMVFCGEKDV